MNIKNCVYRFINNEDEIIYIGKAKNLINRLNCHNHLSKKCYEERKRIDFISFETEEEMNIAERYFIAKIKPKYNIEFSKNNINFHIESLDSALWKRYDLKEIKKEKIIKEKVKFTTIANSIDNDIKELEFSIELFRRELIKTKRKSSEEAFLLKLITKKEDKMEKMKRDKVEKLLFINNLKCEDNDMKKLYIKYYSIDHEEIKMKVMEEIKEKHKMNANNQIKENGFYSRVNLYEMVGIDFINAGSGDKVYIDKWKELVKDKQESKEMQMKIIREVEDELEDIWGEFYDDILYYEHQSFSPIKIKNCKMVRRLKQNI